MATYTLTGEQEQQRVFSAANLVANVSAIGADSDLYFRPHTATDEPTVEFSRSRSSNNRGSVGTSVQLANRRLFRTLLENAAKCVTQLEEATHDEEAYLDQGASGQELLGYLQELWLLRDLREREWKMLLTFIQSSLHSAIFENFTPLQGGCLKSLIVDYLSDSSLTKDKVARAIQLLREARIDVWKGLSQAPTE